jgi:hypothetical protein
MWRIFFGLLLFASAAQAQEQATAYDALLVVGNQFSRAALNRVVSLSGVDGDPQPARWHIVIADRQAPGGVREFEVGDGRIIANRTPERGAAETGEGATIRTAQLNLDSSGAFTVASHTADQSHVNFDYVSYTLRTNERGLPMWMVTIQDQARQPLGTIHISANRGNVTRVEGMYHGRNMAQAEQDPVVQAGGDEEYAGSDVDLEDEAEPEDDGDVNVVKAEIKRMFRRTKHDAQRLFHRVRRSFDDFVDRHR